MVHCPSAARPLTQNNGATARRPSRQYTNYNNMTYRAEKLDFSLSPKVPPRSNMDYGPGTMALITPDCDAMRSPSIKWA